VTLVRCAPMRTLALALLLSSCATTPDSADESDAELQITDTKVGDGEKAVRGSKVTVHYRGTFPDGTLFDSSLTREPLTFKLGARQVIRGWDFGILGMRVGGKRRLVVPPNLGYGERIHGSIPPGSTLVFDVELKQVMP
jgi:FKBP-type peptidyl-prolyl cis-trans isomerase